MSGRSIAPALLRYRILANVVGVLLVVLVFIGVPLKYLAHMPATAAIVGTTHGAFYIVYCLSVLDLAFRARWSLARIVPLMLAGVVPVMTFVMERKVTRSVGPNVTQ